MKIAKDLLYDKENHHLDIARMSALLSVFAYLGMTIYYIVAKDQPNGFDFFEWASGWAALSAGNAAWIYARQRIEARMDFTPPNPRQSDYSYGGGPYYGGGYGYDSGYNNQQGYNQDGNNGR